MLKRINLKNEDSEKDKSEKCYSEQAKMKKDSSEQQKSGK